MSTTFCLIRPRSSKMYGIVTFALIAAVSCNDLIQGPEGGRNIYNETKEASPAIWKQKDEITIKVNDTDVISRIVITDLRPNKDGEVKILEGGQGQKNVTLELKSPTILRGYDFHVEVYATNDNQEIANPERPSSAESHVVPAFTEQTPTMENDTKVNPKDSAAPTEKTAEEIETPDAIADASNTVKSEVNLKDDVKSVSTKKTAQEVEAPVDDARNTVKSKVNQDEVKSESTEKPPQEVETPVIPDDSHTVKSKVNLKDEHSVALDKTLQTSKADPIVKYVKDNIAETLKPHEQIPENTKA